MTLTQVSKKIDALQSQVNQLRQDLDYELAVEGIRRGLASADRGEGMPVKAAFDQIRRKHKPRRK